MKCNCGGKLKKINIDKYQCLVCGKYSAVAFAELPLTNNINVDIEIKITNEIANAFRIPSKFLNGQR